ncbi:hypothetical protein L6R29_10680 [Myxococcota bacterium]|nr:hypothetical protein [Myxococcota bacterium]
MTHAFFLLSTAFLALRLFGCTPSPITESNPHNENDAHNDASSNTETPSSDLPDRNPLPDRKSPKVGTFCQSNADCFSGFSCETQVPNGYCTKFCNHTRECPLDSACARITFEGGFQLQRCISTCRDERDCRQGFLCYLPPSSWDQICIPPTP